MQIGVDSILQHRLGNLNATNKIILHKPRNHSFCSIDLNLYYITLFYDYSNLNRFLPNFDGSPAGKMVVDAVIVFGAWVFVAFTAFAAYA